MNRIGLPLRPWPLLAEFSYGLVIFALYRRLVAAKRWLWGLPPLLIGIDVVLFYTIDGQLPASNGIDADCRRVMVLGLPAEMIVSGLLLGKPRCVSSGNRFLLVLGNASYAMYLLHPLLLGLLLPYPADSFAMRVARFCATTCVTSTQYRKIFPVEALHSL